MKKLSAYLMLFLATGLSVSAQKKLSQKPNYVEWEENPKVHPVPPEYAKEPAIMLLYDVSLDYRFEGRRTNMYYTKHKLVKVLDDRGIEGNNKIKIPVGRYTRVPLIKARTILPDGKVKDIAKDMIKVTKNEYGQNTIVIAMEGVEKNAEIELLIKAINPMYYFGAEQFQFSVPIAEARFSMSFPKELVFEEKGYNGFPTVRDTIIHNRRKINIVQNDIPAYVPEKYSYNDLYTKRVEYKLVRFVDENENDTKPLQGANEIASGIYNDYIKLNEKEKKAVNKYLTELGVAGAGNELEKIKKIENGIKNNIALYADVEGDDNALDSMINKKSATATGYIRLFAACFAQAGVDFELGMAGDRRERKYDAKFENWGNMENQVFYFPHHKKFLSPTNLYCRYPIVDQEILTSKGVFCAIKPGEEPKGITTSAIADIIAIAPLPATESVENLVANVSLNKDMEARVDATYTYSGYTATGLRQAIATARPEQKKELMMRLTPLAEKPDQILKHTVANDGFENYYSNKPLEVFTSVNTPDMITKSGSEYLMKIGSVIGHQISLYGKEPRRTPVDVDYPHMVNRTITVDIPKGYKILNPERLNMHADFVDKDVNPVAAFSSSYEIKTDKVNGDKLVVYVKEYYKQIHYSLLEFEHYRRVVNTAADFSAVTLALGKKK